MGSGVRERKRGAQHSGKKSAATWEEERGDTGDSAATEEGHTPAREGAAARKEGRERGHSAPQLAGDGTACQQGGIARSQRCQPPPAFKAVGREAAAGRALRGSQAGDTGDCCCRQSTSKVAATAPRRVPKPLCGEQLSKKTISGKPPAFRRSSPYQSVLHVGITGCRRWSPVPLYTSRNCPSGAAAGSRNPRTPIRTVRRSHFATRDCP